MPEKTSRRKLYLLVALIAVVSVFFLRDSYWQTALSEREFVALYVEVVRLQMRFADQPLEARMETKKMLERAGVTEEQVNRFIEQINKKPEKWAALWGKINWELERDTTLPRNR